MPPTLCAFSRSPTATIISTTSSSNHSSPAPSARGQEIYSLLRTTLPTGAVAYTLLYRSGETVTVPHSQILNHVTMQQLQEYEHQSFKKEDNMETKYNLRDDMGAWNGGSDMARIERALERLKRELKKRGGGDGDHTDDGGEKEMESKEDDKREKRRMARGRGREQEERGRGKRRRLVDVDSDVEGEQEKELEEDGGGISGSELSEIRPRKEVKAGDRRSGLGDKRPSPSTSSERRRRETMENGDVSAKYKSPLEIASPSSAKTNRPNRTIPKSISTPSALSAHKNASSPSSSSSKPQKHLPGKNNKQQQSNISFYGAKTENSQPKTTSASTTKSTPSSLFTDPLKRTSLPTRAMELEKLPSRSSVSSKSPDSEPMTANDNKKPEYRLKRNRTAYESPDDSTYTPGSRGGPKIVLDNGSDDELAYLPTTISSKSTPQTKSTPSSKSGSESAKQLRHKMRKSLLQQGPSPPPLPHAAPPSSTKKPKSNAPAKGKQNKSRNLTSNDHPNNKSEDEDEEDIFEVESIVGDRIHPITKERQYFVKWKGYSSKDNTWEPREHLTAVEEMLRHYELKKGFLSGKRDSGIV